MTRGGPKRHESSAIRLRGVRVNNLRNIDLDIPYGQLLAICGLSGSGKTSLALDTLFAEGQRRYIECFSPYTRQFLDQLEKPDADRIDGIPPAIAVTASRKGGNSRSTVGSVTETIDYLRLLYKQSATIRCHQCNSSVTRHSPASIVQMLDSHPAGCKFLIAFASRWESAQQLENQVSDIKRNGFRRVIVENKTRDTDHLELANFTDLPVPEMLVVVDRLKTGDFPKGRCAESLETAFGYGQGTAVLIIESPDANTSIDGIDFKKTAWSNRLICAKCDVNYPDPDIALLSFNNAKGACEACEGFGNVSFFDSKKIVPDAKRTLRQGAIAPWNSPAYRHELEEMIEIADEHDLPLDIPFSDLTEKQIEFLWSGDRSRDFGGLNGFFAWLEKRKYKMHLRVFLARWRSWRECEHCEGHRLNPVSLSFQVDEMNIAEMADLPIEILIPKLRNWVDRTERPKQTVKLVETLVERLQFLKSVGVGYLTIGRQLRTLSAGERQRVALTRALGSNLVNLLYVLDEPSAGLHADDIQKLIPQIKRLQERRNTVVMVDHDPAVISVADRIIEMGPEAGRSGGEIVFDGSPQEIVVKPTTATGQFLAGERGFSFSSERRDNRRSRIQISGARGNNLKNITVNFPLDLLCVVSGVSGSGKSTLVRQTLGPALKNRLSDSIEPVLEFEKLHGGDRFDQVAIIDQSSLPRISRSNPATYVKAWDEIRKVFSETTEAKSRNLKPGAFSFNVEGGRCDTCNGEGFLRIDMQFMADVLRRCEQCRGTRFKSEVCQVRYRSRNVSDVLKMTANEAFAFYRGHRKVQARLKLLKDVGLGYVQIGQPVSTLSSGEAQRLKLAAFIGQGSQKRTLFIMDEPSSGLHMVDVVRLIDCFDTLIDVGHSLIVIEHNLLMLAHADHIIDLGPGAATAGGSVVASGTPEQICENSNSVTGRYLKPLLQEVVS